MQSVKCFDKPDCRCPQLQRGHVRLIIASYSPRLPFVSAQDLKQNRKDPSVILKIKRIKGERKLCCFPSHLRFLSTKRRLKMIENSRLPFSLANSTYMINKGKQFI